MPCCLSRTAICAIATLRGRASSAHGVADHRVGPPERAAELIPAARQAGIGDDGAGHVFVPHRQGPRVHVGQHPPGDIGVRVHQDDGPGRGDRPVGPGGCLPDRGHARAIGQQQLGQLLAAAFPGRGVLALLQDVAARGRRRELVDEIEHGFGERRQDIRPDLEGQRGGRDVPPGGACAELVGGEQAGEVRAGVPLTAADLLEDDLDRLRAFEPVDPGRRPAVLGHVEEPVDEQLGGLVHSVRIVVEEGGVLGPAVGEQVPHVGDQLRQPAVEGKLQFRPALLRVRGHRLFRRAPSHCRADVVFWPFARFRTSSPRFGLYGGDNFQVQESL